MSLTTRFTQEYGLRTPIAQAGMAFVGSTPELAIAVCRAGGLGSLGVGLMPAPVLTDAIKAIVAGTAGAFNVNFITVFADQSHIDAVCSAGVPVASFHWGHPSRAWIDQLHSAGTRVFEQVGSVDDARRAVDDGIDVVVAQASRPVVTTSQRCRRSRWFRWSWTRPHRRWCSPRAGSPTVAGSRPR